MFVWTIGFDMSFGLRIRQHSLCKRTSPMPTFLKPSSCDLNFHLMQEYAHLLGIPVSDKVPFSGLEEIPRSHLVAKALHLKNSEIEAHWLKKGGMFGLTFEFLIGKAIAFAQAGSVDTFEAIFVLLIYGLALFPNIDGFVDVNAIRIFLIGNHVPTLLGDMYFSLHLRNFKGGGTIV
ncbi:hypothetical protein KIW84_050516 [Lathyrus oleraceus]|uniref:DUF7745 domain-containing protein n=1 Tax=Pisum sativum TaxID=3888 RepID=A0A9D4WJX9_PEA|nr:hypothetical protein KIW84_050516 [Pisum sativum]